MNIYQDAREERGLTQEQAAELIGISVESLRAYECGKRPPSSTTAVMMSNVYDNKALRYQHLKNTDPIANAILPDFMVKNFAETVLKLIKELNEVEALIPTLIAIAADGIIDESERPTWEKVRKEFDDVVQGYYCMVMSDSI